MSHNPPPFEGRQPPCSDAASLASACPQKEFYLLTCLRIRYTDTEYKLRLVLMSMAMLQAGAMVLRHLVPVLIRVQARHSFLRVYTCSQQVRRLISKQSKMSFINPLGIIVIAIQALPLGCTCIHQAVLCEVQTLPLDHVLQQPHNAE